jgi:hypothetical protein
MYSPTSREEEFKPVTVRENPEGMLTTGLDIAPV